MQDTRPRMKEAEHIPDRLPEPSSPPGLGTFWEQGHRLRGTGEVGRLRVERTAVSLSAPHPLAKVQRSGN
jgi:hypothetical protein